MERSPSLGRRHMLFGTYLLALLPRSSTSSGACSAAFPDCSGFCQAADQCLCNEVYSRCACQNEAAALREGGRCVLGAARGPEARDCAEGELGAAVLLVVGATVSPEVSLEHLAAGRPSAAMNSILQWCTASAMSSDFDKTSIIAPRLISNANATDLAAARDGLIFFDVGFTVCAGGASKLVPGAQFERGFIREWQAFISFPVTSVRVLELRELRWPGAGGPGAVPRAAPPPPSGGHATPREESGGPTLEQFFWIGPAIGTALLLLLCAVCRLLRHKYKNRKRAGSSPRHWGGVAPGFRPEPPQAPQAAPQGPGGGTLATVAYDFDPSSVDGSVFSAAAGLEASECLTVSKGDLLEAFARGDGWLYGRLSGSGLFGHLPEACVLWVDAVGGAGGAPAAAAAQPAAVSALSQPEVMGRFAPDGNAAV